MMLELRLPAKNCRSLSGNTICSVAGQPTDGPSNQLLKKTSKACNLTEFDLLLETSPRLKTSPPGIGNRFDQVAHGLGASHFVDLREIVEKRIFNQPPSKKIS